MSKSHVSMEQRICLAHGDVYDSGAILLDTRIQYEKGRPAGLRQSMERHTITGWGLCPECQIHYDDGMIALVEIDPVKSSDPPTAEGVYRLGGVCHIKEEVAQNLFGGVPTRRADGTLFPIMYIDTEVMALLEKAAAESQGQEEEGGDTNASQEG